MCSWSKRFMHGSERFELEAVRVAAVRWELRWLPSLRQRSGPVRRWWSRGWYIRAEGKQQVRCSMRRSGALCYKCCNRLRSLASRCPSHLHTRNLQPKKQKNKENYLLCALSLSLSLSRNFYEARHELMIAALEDPSKPSQIKHA